MPQANIDNPASESTESTPQEPENPDSTEVFLEPANTEITQENQTPQMPANEPFVTEQNLSILRQLLNKAQEAIQFRKRKKLDKIMSMFETKSKITNDEVEKLLHVSDATATRYLTILKQENKIKQEGKTGKSVFYSKI
jgi:predicted HTH transcriptional regulator